MKNYWIILLLFTGILPAQVTMQVSLPTVATVNSEVEFELKIKKGSIINFSKYQLDVPDGITIEEIDSRDGSFSFSDNRLKIIWAITPPENEYSIRMKLLTGPTAGTKTFAHKYFFIRGNDKVELEMEPITINVVNEQSAIPVSRNFRQIKSKLPSSVTEKVQADSVLAGDPEELSLQVAQLKKDSKDAFTVGTLEKDKAEAKIWKASADLKKAEGMKDGPAKTEAIKNAKTLQLKGDEELAVATKILLLAKTLEENAVEIERITGLNAVADTVVAGKEEMDPGLHEETPVEQVEAGITYRLQLGAFSKNPGMAQYKKIGTVTIENENGIYKVMMGNFATKADALNQREQIRKKGVDGFVVAFRNGVRIK